MFMPTNQPAHSKTRVHTAVLLAAGTGSRLKPLTDNAPKCLSEVSGIAIVQRLVESLCDHGFTRLVIVVGHLDHRIREFLDEHSGSLQIEYIINRRYATTNNLYSLWLARQTIDEPCLLLESDVVFDSSLLVEMLQPNRMAVSRMQDWMNGTTVTVDALQNVTAFQVGALEAPGEVLHKTVNMYSFSQTTWRRLTERLSVHVNEGHVNEYYETVIAEMLHEGILTFDAVPFDGGRWYEIDTLEDLEQAELLFPITAVVSGAIDNLPPVATSFLATVPKTTLPH